MDLWNNVNQREIYSQLLDLQIYMTELYGGNSWLLITHHFCLNVTIMYYYSTLTGCSLTNTLSTQLAYFILLFWISHAPSATSEKIWFSMVLFLPCEPSLIINSYLSPLVSELNQLWWGVQLSLPGSYTAASFKCALLGVACDLPAARKSWRFLSYSANLGCSRCFQKFSRGFGNRNNYADFDRESWVMHTNVRHRSDVQKVFQNWASIGRISSWLPLQCFAWPSLLLSNWNVTDWSHA